MSDSPSILIIRRDNIGDLVCTTPLMMTLRKHFPQAHITALVNSYTADVLAHHPALNEVVYYTKAKHAGSILDVMRAYWQRLCLMLALRKRRFDFAILAAPGFQPRLLRLARTVGAREIVGYVQAETPQPLTQQISKALPWPTPLPNDSTQTEQTSYLLNAIGIHEQPGPSCIAFNPQAVSALLQQHPTLKVVGDTPPPKRIGIHISARKPSQRWSEQAFAELMQQLAQTASPNHPLQFIVLWAPGDENNAQHPGDDQKAARLVASTRALNIGAEIVPIATTRLEELIAAISLCDDFICADGGAMHIAAGLGKPIVCLFGQSSATHWRPWGVPYRLLQKETLQVLDISAAEVAEAYKQQRAELKEQEHCAAE